MDDLSDDVQKSAEAASDELEAKELQFLIEEGLEMLATFRSIRDIQQRRLIFELAKVLADQSPKT